MTPHRLLDHAALVAAREPRPDAAAKLTGHPGYLTDRIAPGQLHGAILGSPLPHARIVTLDVSAARALPGVHAVVTAADIPGDTHYGLRHVDRPVLCADKVRCIADPIAAVAAETPEIARAALAAIRLELEPLPVVGDPEAALAPEAPKLHEDRANGNLLHAARLQRGDLAAAQAACVHVVEAVYESPRQMHVTLETEGGVAEPDGQGGLTLYFGGQNPERDRQVIAAMLRLPPDKVRAVGMPVGGSYGAKDELTIQPIAALLAWKSGRAVRLHLSRPASTDLGVKRHPMRMRMRTGCDAEGRLRFQQVDILADTGAYATHGPEVLDAAIEHAVGPYAYDAVEVQGRLAYTNNGIAGAFRGFGAVQVQFALEQQIDRLARASGLGPVEFRRRNLAAPDAPGPMGQVVAPFDGPHRALDVIAQHPLWREAAQRAADPAADARFRRGVGLALVHRSDGFGRGGPNGARLALALGADGRIELRASLTEMGQNLLGATRAIVARQLGCSEDDVRPVLGDSAQAPDTGPASASRSTTLVHRALHRHGPDWAARLTALAADVLGVPAQTLRWGPGGWHAGQACVLRYAELAQRLAAAGTPLPHLEIELPGEETPSAIEAAHYVFGACAAAAQVCVDTWTGAVRVEHLAIAAALGPVASRMGFLGQMEGGALMGQGLATTEDLPTREGRYLARNLDGYLVPTLADAPRYDVTAIENLMEGDEIGPRGAGEISVNIAAPAVANAVTAAIGMPVDRLPIRPDTVLDYLEQNP
ncbi:xanthine dehydrogenase family protein molybdopterin-binding subunit [Caldimonas thermodepolymerans]|uniref:xanthine dehydrogenase family protein molybdopterin-binding subunit n=1 Tax=Caldimonas thermodepolymerans TaxID=215580 RepID=UPI002235AF8D|nr:molybdopterin cofactor-binding domain-containing protein [Caldimonas thermodepolymerans]UZG44673.1 molybdopterin-dependent oxidoreductase [Caldimonas thermodepolymerans]